MKHFFKTLCISIICICTILVTAGCTEKEETKKTSDKSISVSENIPELWKNAKYTNDTELGDGSKTIKIEIKAEDKSILLTVHTDKKNLADALTEYKLISGDDSEFGLYIKEVNGITADYDINKAFWTISKDGTSLAVGAESTNISDGENYEFTYSKE